MSRFRFLILSGVACAGFASACISTKSNTTRLELMKFLCFEGDMVLVPVDVTPCYDRHGAVDNLCRAHLGALQYERTCGIPELNHLPRR